VDSHGTVKPLLAQSAVAGQRTMGSQSKTHKKQAFIKSLAIHYSIYTDYPTQ
jgi:hypothetical protein